MRHHQGCAKHFMKLLHGERLLGVDEKTAILNGFLLYYIHDYVYYDLMMCMNKNLSLYIYIFIYTHIPISIYRTNSICPKQMILDGLRLCPANGQKHHGTAETGAGDRCPVSPHHPQQGKNTYTLQTSRFATSKHHPHHLQPNLLTSLKWPWVRATWDRSFPT